jgi:hypothetical protein
MTSRGVVYQDEIAYPKLRLPKNWTQHHEPVWGSLQASMQWCYETFPDASHYGWLADDTRPRTQGWDRQLEHAAGDWGLSYARDLWYSETPLELDGLQKGRNMSSGLCWAGSLVREVGWWALPGVRQAGIDTAWMDIVRPLGLHRYTHDVVVEHLNWQTGKRERDAGDEWSREGVNYVERDLVVKNEWSWSPGYRELLERVARAAGVEADRATIRQSYIDELWRAGTLNETKIRRIQEGWHDAQIFSAHADAEPA